MSRLVSLVVFSTACAYARRVATTQGEVASHSSVYAPLAHQPGSFASPSLQMQEAPVGNPPQFDHHAPGTSMQAAEEYNPNLSDGWRQDKTGLSVGGQADGALDNMEQPALGSFVQHTFVDAGNISRVALFDTRSPKAEGPHSQSLRALTALLEEECEKDEAACLLEESATECFVRNQVDGPWADQWARYVLLRPGMSYSQLKRATFQRNQLDPRKRIPGTARTIVLAHAICFVAAIPAVLTSDAVFPKILGLATAARISSGIP